MSSYLKHSLIVYREMTNNNADAIAAFDGDRLKVNRRNKKIH